MENGSQPAAMPAETKSPRSSKGKRLLFVGLGLIIIVLLGVLGYLVYRFSNLQRDVTPTKSGSTPLEEKNNCLYQPGSFFSCIKKRDTASGVKTVNTDKWVNFSGTGKLSFDYSYKYPENLYAAPNVRGESNSLYFFESKETYMKYEKCIKEKTGTFEYDCDASNFLFSLWINPGDLKNVSSYPDKLTEIMSDDGEYIWIVPDKDEARGGEGDDTFYIVYGNRGNSDFGSVTINLRYLSRSEEKIKSLTGLDPYNLLLHLLSSFKVKVN